jgi:hypothetical protein
MAGIPEPKNFFLETPLYAEFPIGAYGDISVLKVQFFRATMDAHCLECGKEAVFQCTNPPLRAADGKPRTHGSPPAIDVDELLGGDKRAHWPYAPMNPGGPTGPLTLDEMRPLAIADRLFEVSFSCMREETHRLVFFFRVHGGRSRRSAKRRRWRTCKARGSASTGRCSGTTATASSSRPSA